jgi:hypothetical protein
MACYTHHREMTASRQKHHLHAKESAKQEENIKTFSYEK